MFARPLFYLTGSVLLTLLLCAAQASGGQPATGNSRTQTSGTLAAGTPWETPWYAVDTGVPGPVLMVTGGIHGNEPAGWRAAEQIRHWPIVRGRLIVVPKVNTLGLEAGQRWLPPFRDDKTLRDPNRNFPQEGGDDQARTIPCQALWELAERERPTWVLDLHEGFSFHVANRKSVGSSIIYFRSDETEPLVTEMQEVVNATIDEPQRRFVRLGRTGPVEGSFARAAIERLDCQGFILETTFREQPLSLRVRQHRMMVSTVMRRLGMIRKSCIETLIPDETAAQRHVGLYDGTGTGSAGVHELMKIFDGAPDFVLHVLGPEDLRSAPLDGFSLLIFPGGSGSRQAQAIGSEARERVRAYVRSGGGYLGICAGAYLCSAHYDWSLDLIDTKVFTGSREIAGVGKKQMWHRGPSATVKLQLTDAGRRILGGAAGLIDVRYHNGPIVSPAGDPDLPTYLPLAHFRSEVAAWEPQEGTMVDTAAIVAASFGEGRVMSVSPHPESTAETRDLLRRAARWLCGMEEPAATETPAASTVGGSD